MLDQTDDSKALLEEIEQALADDFNFPKAFGLIFECIRLINTKLDAGEKVSGHIVLLHLLEDIFGIIPSSFDPLPAEIQLLVDRRAIVRQNKDFAAADQLRDQISALGYQIDDTPYGPLVKKK